MLTQEEIKFYRDLYSALNTTGINNLLIKYANMQYTKSLNKLRSKQEQYEYAYANGNADAWQNVMNLQRTLLDILKNT